MPAQASTAPSLADSRQLDDVGPEPAAVAGEHVQVIEPRTGWQPIDWGELVLYRDLLYFLVWRDGSCGVRA